MGCTNSALAVEYVQSSNQPSQPQSRPKIACYPVPFGHVPYTPALPGAMGPLLDFPLEWWYYGGWAEDETGTKFTILTLTMRIGTTAAILYGIGNKENNADSFFTSQYYVELNGEFPPPTASSWSVTTSSQTNLLAMNCKLISGILGLSGATYQLDMQDEKENISASFVLKDNFGMILEGASGAYHKTGGEDSFEFAMPSLAIEDGSVISIKGITTKLCSGNIWLDRQTIGGNISLLSKNPLYVGNWLALTMNDKTVYNIVFFWPKKPDQWIVGTKLDHPINPKHKFGVEYPFLPEWDGQGHPAAEGVNVLKESDIDLNILNPDNPSQSPHWKSPHSGQTYCTAWKLKIKNSTYTMKALIPQSEVYAGTYFFEGAGSIYDEEVEVGHVFIEQMGYN